MSGSKPHTSYYQATEFTATLGGQAVRVISKPGFPNWDRVTPTAALLADLVKLPAEARVLVLGCGHGALAVVLSRQIPHGDLWLMDTNYVALMMAKRTLQANNVRNAQVYEGITVLPAQANTFDTVVVEVRKDRKLARRWLAEAFGAMKQGGQLYLAGANEQGIRSVINDAEALFGNATVLGYKKGHRVARATKQAEGASEPTWLKEPGIAPGTWHEFKLQVLGNSLRLRSLPGIFAYDRLDEGTSLLLSQLDVPPSSRVLDIGCGYGIIGLVVARLGAAWVDMVDNNVLAVAAARENIAYNDIPNAQALLSDGLSAVGERRYKLVVTNPPFHVGKAQDYEVAHVFIEQARHALEPGGRFILVANKFIRYDQVMRPLFTQVECLAETGRYHVLAAT